MKFCRYEQGTIEYEIEQIKQSGLKKNMLLHACCAPCATSVIEYLKPYFNLTIYFYNPNIMPVEEYEKRLESMHKLMSHHSDIKFIIPNQSEKEFRKFVKGFEDCEEGGSRCTKCFELRIKNTSNFAQQNKNDFDFFATTLTVSPHKNFSLINQLGESVSKNLDVKYLKSNFKKRNGFLRSTELSKEYGLYRQTYCGCKFD